MTKAMQDKKAAAAANKKGSSKKRKQRSDEDGKDKKKKIGKVDRPAPTSTTAASAVMDKVAKELAERQKNKPVSSAIQSLYTNKDGSSKIKGNYLTMGTFNRYS